MKDFNNRREKTGPFELTGEANYAGSQLSNPQPFQPSGLYDLPEPEGQGFYKPNVTETGQDYIEDIQTLMEQLDGNKNDIETIQTEIVYIKDDPNQDYEPDNTSPDSAGLRVANALHVFDDTNATRILQDYWKFEGRITASVGSGITFRLDQTPISRTDDTLPLQAGIKLIRPDGAEISGTGSGSGATASGFVGNGSGNLDVGDVWTAQYKFDDALNFVGDTDTPTTGWITFMTFTVIQTPITGAAGPYVLIDVTTKFASYNNVSGATA